jgi:hypothetical protein
VYAPGCRAPAWRPGPRHVLTYAAGPVVVTQDVDSGRVLWRRAGAGALAWSTDGRRLLVRSPHRLDVLDARGRRLATFRFLKRVLAASFAPGSHDVAVHLRGGTGGHVASELRLVGPGTSRRLFAASGAFGDIAWSPDARWLLVTWPSADQWLFVPRGGGRIRAVGNISAQFPSGLDGPHALRIAAGWCCAP